MKKIILFYFEMYSAIYWAKFISDVNFYRKSIIDSQFETYIKAIGNSVKFAIWQGKLNILSSAHAHNIFQNYNHQ